MPFTQPEADSLLQMTKEFVDFDPLEFTQTQPINYDRLLCATHGQRVGARTSEL